MPLPVRFTVFKEPVVYIKLALFVNRFVWEWSGVLFVVDNIIYIVVSRSETYLVVLQVQKFCVAQFNYIIEVLRIFYFFPGACHIRASKLSIVRVLRHSCGVRSGFEISRGPTIEIIAL